MGFHRTREGTEEEEDVDPGHVAALGEGGSSAAAQATLWPVGKKGGETDQR